MKRIAMTVNLVDAPGAIEQYEAYHANPWPAVMEGNRRIGVHRCFIYRFARRLFMFMEVEDSFNLERDLPRYMDNPKAQEWDKIMRTFQETVPGAPAGSTWIEMKEIFALEDAR